MSYSRWSNSPWYTYWNSSFDHPTLTIHSSLTASIDVPYMNVEGRTDEQIMEGVIEINFSKHKEKERIELLGYIKEFIADVEESK